MKRNCTLVFLLIFSFSIGYGQDFHAVKVDPPAMKSFTFQSPNRDDMSVLYDQFLPGSIAFPSQYFSLLGRPPVEPRIQCADDFDVPEGQSWSIAAVGVLFMSFETPGSFDVFIYQNQIPPLDAMNGMPGNLIAGFAVLPYQTANINPPFFGYLIYLPSPIEVPAGSYWISVVARVEDSQFPVPSQNWVESGTPPAGLGSEFYALAEPFNPFWTPGSVFFSTDPTNLAFALGGEITEISNVPLSPYAILGAVLLIAVFIAFRGRIFKF